MLVNKSLPSIPDYFRMYVDQNINLADTPQIPCPFHKEVHGKSFSYKADLGIWRCFGACHTGGDVIELHRLNYKMKSREEAKKSLYQMYGIDLIEKPNFEKKEIEVNQSTVHSRRVYAMALKLAKEVDDWIELDYILSKIPYDVKELEVFCTARGYVFKEESNVSQ